MNYRFMRVIVFFDLPTETTEDKANYRQFRKALIRNGFLMMQESVYCRLLIQPTAGKTVIDTVRKQGEETARTIKNAFKEASVPSKGLLL